MEPNASGRPLVILFDTDFGGHIPLHATEFAKATLEREFAFDVLLCLPQAILGRLPPEVVQQFASGGRVRFHALSEGDVSASNSANSIERGVNKWRLGQTIAKEHGAKHVFYFVLDVILAGALLTSLAFKPVVPFSGILFRPRLHLPEQHEAPMDWIKRVRQFPYYAAALSLPKLTDVWVLDPFFVTYARRWLPMGKKVDFIGESRILPKQTSSVTDKRTGPVRFLMFGLLKERKGVLVLLRALSTFDSLDWANVRVVLLGEFEKSIRDEALTLAKEIQRSPNARLTISNQYVSTEKIVEEVGLADVILVNYLNHVGSSGVAFAAALAGKPIVTQANGLLGKLARTYGLGPAIDTFDHNALAAEIKRLSQRDNLTLALDPAKSHEYVALNRPGFACEILSTLEAHVTAW